MFSTFLTREIWQRGAAPALWDGRTIAELRDMEDNNTREAAVMAKMRELSDKHRHDSHHKHDCYAFWSA